MVEIGDNGSKEAAEASRDGGGMPPCPGGRGLSDRSET
jgi:hypothetical protein